MEPNINTDLNSENHRRLERLGRVAAGVGTVACVAAAGWFWKNGGVTEIFDAGVAFSNHELPEDWKNMAGVVASATGAHFFGKKAGVDLSEWRR